MESTGSFAVVTGASSGIGYELAAEFARHGFDVLAADENEEIEDAARELAEHGTAVEAFCVDLGTDDGAQALYRKIRASGKPVDAIAINAGLGVNGPFAGTSLRAQLNVVNLNVTSVVHLIHRVLHDMLARHRGRILFTSSLAGPAPGPLKAAYTASKAFLKSFGEALQNELKDSGVTVTVLIPAESGNDNAAALARQAFDVMMTGDVPETLTLSSRVLSKAACAAR